MTTKAKLGDSPKGLFTIEDIDTVLFTLDDISVVIGDCLESSNTHGYDESHESKRASYEEFLSKYMSVSDMLLLMKEYFFMNNMLNKSEN